MTTQHERSRKLRQASTLALIVIDQPAQRFSRDDYNPPYGYHHILRFYNDGSYYLEATINDYTSIDTVIQIALLIADGCPVKHDPDFYRRFNTFCQHGTGNLIDFANAERERYKL